MECLPEMIAVAGKNERKFETNSKTKQKRQDEEDG